MRPESLFFSPSTAYCEYPVKNRILVSGHLLFHIEKYSTSNLGPMFVFRFVYYLFADQSSLLPGSDAKPVRGVANDRTDAHAIQISQQIVRIQFGAGSSHSIGVRKTENRN